jgi:aspartyl-tRNA(Asn)/glutamyl-tRNA(Gln) amidotransferase subunit B
LPCLQQTFELLKGASGDWEVVIGLEVHAQVSSQVVSGRISEFGGAPNSHVSLVDAAMPGMLPVINAECVRQAVRTGRPQGQDQFQIGVRPQELFLSRSTQGYQISQYKSPVVGEGEVAVDMPDGESIRIGIEQLPGTRRG